MFYLCCIVCHASYRDGVSKHGGLEIFVSLTSPVNLSLADGLQQS